MKKLLFLFISILIITLNNNVIQANDTALTALGDNVGPFQGTPDVVLDHEIINIDVYQDKTTVDVTFYLKNVANTQAILVGFPDEFASTRIAGQEDFDFSNTIGPINDFKTYVNGIPVNSTVKYQILDKTNMDGMPTKYKELWHTFPVTFKANEMTVIRNTYWVENGIDVLGTKNFRYTIKTGKKWKGLIGSTKIYVNLKDGLNFNDIIKENSTKGITYVDNKRAMWEFKNFEPDENAGNAYFFLMFKKNLAAEMKKRLLTAQDLKGFTPWELKVLRNEIFARHGRAFKSESLSSFFNSCDWYRINPNYSDNMLNSFEKNNANIILNYEKKIGSKIIYKD